MRRLLLLDADVVIDLHSLNLFDKIRKSYHLHVTRKVLEEAKYYKTGRDRIPIEISQKVTIVENVDVDSLRLVQEEAREAGLCVDQGEATSIAYLLQSEGDIIICLCDKAAIKLISYMELEHRSTSLQNALQNAGHHSKLYPRHLESNFKQSVKDGKALRVQKLL